MMKSGQKRPRFGLLELLLLTGVIAAWLPTYMATKKIPDLESEIERMTARTEDLQIVDDTKLCLRSVPSIWTNVRCWKYFAPKNADLELRVATEGIQNIEYPAEYRSVALPVGEHRLHLKYTSDNKGYLTEVYLDDALVLTESKPKDWIDSMGYSSQSDASDKSTAYAVDEPLALRRMRYSYRHPFGNYNSYDFPDSYDDKGSYLWIAPKLSNSVEPPLFVSPSSKSSRQYLGHRQGAVVMNRPYAIELGLLKVLPSYFAVLGLNEYSWSSRPTLISVRPIAEGSQAAESPEQQARRSSAAGIGLSYILLDTIDPATAKKSSYAASLRSARGALSDDGRTMRLFVHYAPFPSGAQPIVEMIFDADRPDAIGFLIHEAPGSTPLKACQLVTMKDADYQWQEIALTAAKQDNDGTVKRSLAEFYPEAPKTESEEADSSTVPSPTVTPTAVPSPTVPELEWITIPVDQLPMESVPDHPTTRRLSFHTTITDFSKVLYPLGVPMEWKYEGIPNSQTWSLPVSAKDDEPVTVDVRGTRVFPGTNLAIPNGMVVQNVRVTIPLEQREPVWLSYTADSAPASNVNSGK